MFRFRHLQLLRISSRFASSAAQPILAAPAVAKRSTFRTSMLAFLVGALGTGVIGTIYLAEEYRSAYGQLLIAIEELKQATKKTRDSTQRIDQVALLVDQLKTDAVTETRLCEVRQELRRLQEFQAMDHLELAIRVKELEKEVSVITGSK